MSGLFIEILNMSFSASCVALIVMLIRLALRKAPKIYSYALWVVVFFRLVCPFTLQLPVSAVPVQPQTIPYDIVSSESPSIQSGVPVVDNAVNTVIERSLLSASPANSVNPVQIALEIGTYLWLASGLALLLYGIISYLRLKKRVMTAIRVHDNIYETDLIKTPFVLGFVHTKIYIPTGLGEKEMEYVIEHERTHIKRLDYLIKPFAFLISSAHWFNPIVWVSYVLMARDMELSADESVMKRSDFDIRGNYSNSLLALSIKKSGLLSPLAFGETGVRARVKNVLHYKKPAFWVSVVATVVVVAVSLSLVVSKQMETSPENLSNQGAELNSISETLSDAPEAAYDTKYNKVKIGFLSDMTGFKSAYEFETTDSKIVAYIDSTLRTSQTPTEEANLNNNHINQYMIKLSNEIGGYSCGLYYDTLYDKAYIVKDGGLYETGTDFARYIDSFLENTNITFNIDETDAVALFKEYGWTLDYQISAMKNKLNDINILSVFNPNAYYFAYNNELSKDIGLDMSEYSNTADIDVEIYRIHESMPQEFYPIQNCRGIVVKNGDKIIGAFISAGRHSAFDACSLKGNSFEKVTDQTLYEWLAGMIKADSTEERLSKLEPEQVIEEYFTALDNKDAKTAGYCISKKTLLENLTSNMLNEELFNEGIGLPLTDVEIGVKSSFDNLKSAKLSKVEQIDENDKNVKIFRVTVNLQYNEEWSIGSGEQFWDCSMVYESPQTGWKIESFGH
ncbi:Signal transducer regulating beta-lactamase production, contains metallopeptidase domain [Anaerovirgula multivorans]|uniref:Signal transducer regulating beta-lactamase production, contains metallopeptidase domain n=1 Tax=Anaerovirgula multivorans TaxID=312168 RepID=A0A239D131_9FIRM|nr:M56 family metallopeptidase [Anaerovirgula multivorans]SNS25919.1 Signal transducer regulating beta-lactamase production, contains metallopeptidase domain [Anaerovirgula multivorans]